MKTLIFKIQGRHESHSGEAVIVDSYNEGTIEMLNNLPGSMNNLKTNLIGVFEYNVKDSEFNGNYKIYENYYESGSNDYGYFAIKNNK